MQPRFTKIFLIQSLMLAGLIGLAQFLLGRAPTREELGRRAANLDYAPAMLDPGQFAPLRLMGAWTLTSNDPRFGGVSALAVDGGGLLALTDSAVAIRFAKPGRGRARGRIAAQLFELPGGPGSRAYKYDRDSEALLRDPRGRGWWVGFENFNQLWLYDPHFTRALGRIDFGVAQWPRNVGIEGLASAGGDVLIFPERGAAVVRLAGGRAVQRPISAPRGRISDVARLPSGALVVIHRHWNLGGFANELTWLGPAPGGALRTLRSVKLGGSRRDNFEALAAERLPGGNIRLWLMTDDNSQRPLRTLLVALDVPEKLGG